MAAHLLTSAHGQTLHLLRLHKGGRYRSEADISADLWVRALVRRSSVQPFATHLIAPGFKTPAIAKAHFLVSRTTSVGLMRLAQKASGTRGFRAFALVVHGFLYSGST